MHFILLHYIILHYIILHYTEAPGKRSPSSAMKMRRSSPSIFATLVSRSERMSTACSVRLGSAPQMSHERQRIQNMSSIIYRYIYMFIYMFISYYILCMRYHVYVCIMTFREDLSMCLVASSTESEASSRA